MNPRPPPERLSDQLLRERKQRERKMTRPVLEVILILAIPAVLLSGVYGIVLELGGPVWASDLLVPIGAVLTFAIGRKRLARIERETRARRRNPSGGRGEMTDEP